MGQVLSRSVVIIILLITFSIPRAYAERNQQDQLNIVFVNTDRGSFTDTDKYIEYVTHALEFWGITPALSISTQYHARAYENFEWIDLYKDELTLYIVYTNGAAFVTGTHGAASYELMFAVITSSSSWPEAIIAHEFGHLMFGLPDLYHDNPCNVTDIMCNPVQAYRMGMIGCQSLATLGKPCMFVSLPLIH